MASHRAACDPRQRGRHRAGCRGRWHLARPGGNAQRHLAFALGCGICRRDRLFGAAGPRHHATGARSRALGCATRLCGTARFCPATAEGWLHHRAPGGALPAHGRAERARRLCRFRREDADRSAADRRPRCAAAERPLPTPRLPRLRGRARSRGARSSLCRGSRASGSGPPHHEPGGGLGAPRHGGYPARIEDGGPAAQGDWGQHAGHAAREVPPLP